MCGTCEFTFEELHDFSHEEIVDFLIKHGVLKDSTNCQSCGQVVKLNRKKLRFQCCKRVSKNKQKPTKCNWVGSARVGSFIAGSKVPLKRLWCLVLNILFLDSTQEILVKSGGFSNLTVVDWKSLVRDVLLDHFTRHSKQTGGPGKIVKLYEAKFNKFRNTLGRIKGKWVLGGIERKMKLCFLVAVPDNTARTLIRLVHRWVLPGTTVITDSWKIYQQLKQYKFHHLTVEHSLSLVNPHAGACNNIVERHLQNVQSVVPKNSKQNEQLGNFTRFLFTERYSYHNYAHAFYTAAADLYPPIY